MVRFGKKVAVLTLAGAIAAMSVTGCGSIKEDATVATVTGCIRRKGLRRADEG